MCSQVNGNYKTRDLELTELLQQVHELIKKKNLKSELRWIPRQENLAGKLL
jgi:hypothetical protein